MDVSFLTRFGRSVINVGRMIRDRGYVLKSGSDFSTYDDALQVVGLLYKKSGNCSLADSVRSVYEKPNGLLMLWCFDRNYDTARNRERMISTDQVKALQELISKASPATHIVISPNKLSPQAKKELLASPVEIFLFEELMIELPKHELVMKHTVVTEAHVRSVLGQALRLEDLPLLPTSDPMAKWLGLKPGQLVFIDNPVMMSWRLVC